MGVVAFSFVIASNSRKDGRLSETQPVGRGVVHACQ